ncbi:MAG: hypothetical protein Q4B03_00320 [Lachnospiraceae bacterium]|nr:hypothetical protein [Lachnospiraceae bacterium]
MKRYNKAAAAVFLAVSLTAVGCGGETQTVEEETTVSEETETTGSETTGSEAAAEADGSSSSEKAQAAIEAAVDAALESQEEALNTEDLGSNEGVDLSVYEETYSFTLAGREYSLSCPVQELLDDGWRFSNEAVTMDGTEVITLNEAVQKGVTFDAIETPDFSMFKTIDGTTYEVMMGIYSDSNEPKTMGELRLGYLYVKEDLGLDLVLGTGITFGDSEAAVREVYGEPTSEAEGILSYQFTDGEVALMPDRPDFLNFYVNDGKVYMISMQYFPVLSK